MSMPKFLQIDKETNQKIEHASQSLDTAIGNLESELEASGISKDDKVSRLSYVQDKLQQNRVARSG